MKIGQYILALFFFLGLLVLVQGCGQSGLDNPLGVLGGGANGYGSSGFRDYSSDFDTGGGTASEIVGTWRREVAESAYEIYRFYATGQYQHLVEAYGQSQIIDSGTYSINGNTITFHPEDTVSFSVTFSINGNTLTLNGVDYYRS